MVYGRFGVAQAPDWGIKVYKNTGGSYGRANRYGEKQIAELSVPRIDRG